MEQCALVGNSPTNQLAVSQVADWSTRGIVNSPKCLILILEHIIAISIISDRLHLYALSVFDRVRFRVRIRFTVHL